MSFKKGLFLGTILGGAAAFAAYHSLDEEKQYELRNTVLDAVEDAKDCAFDYAYYAADSFADAKDSANYRVNSYKDSFDDASEKVSNKLLDLKEDLSDLQTYLNLIPVPKTPEQDLEKDKESDDITLDMDDAFSTENDNDNRIVEKTTEEHRD
ncbi:YtxH domain-containing protein [Fructilactobacillus sanfranciscensis]|uniref:YtxH domain-containing protein n=1 Tax=Fructilactobacillus sanfranciscensis TaxID=1625 RepID=UPI00111BCC9F|nr:YtxH domain-containing protein [Fructilactobacillus sanfranciscensis]TNK98366.1 hypothetical protein DKP75_00825 [Fructilactobacillus sanfranciscensis]